MVWLVPAAIAALIVFLVAYDLNFKPTGARTRIVDFAIAAVLLPLGSLSLYLLFQAIRWLTVVIWPGPLGVFCFKDRLELALGPWGRKVYDVDRLDLRYLFEMDEEEHGGEFEAYLPEDQQRREFLPPMAHPDSLRPLSRVILDRTLRAEAEAAAALRPAIDVWRRDHGIEDEDDD